MRGVVAAGNPYTARAAAEVLARGGNAVDAAVAGAFVAFVAEPLLASAGGGGLLTVAAPDGTCAALDFFATVPGARPAGLDFTAVEVDFASTTQVFHVGRGSAAVPLALPGLLAAVAAFGRDDPARLVRPAVELAQAGAELSPDVAMVFRLLWPILRREPETLRAYSTSGRCPVAGERHANPALAATLLELGARGGVPPQLDEAVLRDFGPARGGCIAEADLREARVVRGAPLALALGDHEVLIAPSPGGQLVQVILGALRESPPERDEAAELLRFARASRRGHAQRGVLLAPGSTTHLSVIDAGGGAAALTLTNGEGCGHLAGATGVQLNNFLGEEDLNPHGFHRHPRGVRLPTMMAPTIVRRDGVPVLALGSGGSNRIRSAVAHTLYRVACLGESLEQAVRAPRIHAEDDRVWVELAGLARPESVVAALRSEFTHVHGFPERAFFFGGVHAVQRGGDGTLRGIGDARRGGAVVVL